MLASCTGKVTEQNLGKDFETLLGMLRPEESVNKNDIKIIKEQIFGPNVFWVTETRATEDVLEGGIVVCSMLCVKNIFLMNFLRVTTGPTTGQSGYAKLLQPYSIGCCQQPLTHVDM